MPITDGMTTTTPAVWAMPVQKAETQNRVHPLLSGRTAVTLGGVTPRRGTLALLYLSEAAAAACVQLHRTAAVLQLDEPSRPSMSMTYVLADGGGISVELDPDHADHWMVAIDYQEVIE